MKFLWAGNEFLVVERENNEIVTQTATVVFASANVGAYTETETGEIELEIANLSLGRFEVHENTTVASHRRLEGPGTSIIYYRNPGISPFATIQNKGWRVDALSIPDSGVKALSLCPFPRG